MEYKMRYIHIGNKRLRAKVANDMAKRGKGLSGAKKLKDNECMLFIFHHAAKYPVWMRGMNFPIDILWLDEQKKIIDMRSDMKPARHILDFSTYSPRKEAKYAIELPAGFVKDKKVKTSTSVKF